MEWERLMEWEWDIPAGWGIPTLLVIRAEISPWVTRDMVRSATQDAVWDNSHTITAMVSMDTATTASMDRALASTRLADQTTPTMTITAAG